MSGAGAGQEEDKKPADQAAVIKLTVTGQDGNKVVFQIKRSTQLLKLMNAYCDRMSVLFKSTVCFKCISFIFNARNLRGEQTPAELEMADGDEIYSSIRQPCIHRFESESESREEPQLEKPQEEHQSESDSHPEASSSVPLTLSVLFDHFQAFRDDVVYQLGQIHHKQDQLMLNQEYLQKCLIFEVHKLLLGRDFFVNILNIKFYCI